MASAGWEGRTIVGKVLKWACAFLPVQRMQPLIGCVGCRKKKNYASYHIQRSVKATCTGQSFWLRGHAGLFYDRVLFTAHVNSLSFSGLIYSILFWTDNSPSYLLNFLCYCSRSLPLSVVECGGDAWRVSRRERDIIFPYLSIFTVNSHSSTLHISLNNQFPLSSKRCVSNYLHGTKVNSDDKEPCY